MRFSRRPRERAVIPLFALAFLLDATKPAGAVDVRACSDALVRSTYQLNTRFALGWQLAEHVSQSAYDEHRRSAGISVPIYGVPVGADYNDFRRNIQTLKRGSTSSLTVEQATNLMWTGLSDSPTAPYQSCLSALVAGMGGLRLAVRRATEADVTMEVKWVPQGSQAPIEVPVQWSGATPPPGERLPDRVTAGSNIVRVMRPGRETSVTLNTAGFGDSLVLTPLPRMPEPPPPCGGVRNARAPFGVSPNPTGVNFIVDVPECGAFSLYMTVSMYIWGASGPVGEHPASLERVEVRRRLKVESGSDRNGPCVGVHIDREPQPDPTNAQVYVRRGGVSQFAQIAPEWPQSLEAIQATNRRLTSSR